MASAAQQLDFDGYPARFFQWLSSNEHVYAEFKKRALRMALMGRKRYSAKTIVETIRWDTEIADTDVEFKLNNNFTSGMARLFMAEYGGRFPDFFQLRDSLGRDVPRGAFSEQ